ncbi:MAG: anaerobic ribonucleoside-triphosphate reductase activating protein [bacterium]|nr:anaerobic ribonucleoside-triphosphate reductase activating protein [bacterium]
MLIGGLQKTTLIDYPGKVACTVFLVGCNFRCPWCYSSELVLPEKIKKLPKMTERDFFKFLKDRQSLLDGVVLCGGEPTLNQDLPEFVKKIKKLGFLVKLDTNGSNSKMLKRLIREKLINYIAMDIKAPIAAKIQNPKSKYQKATGVKVNLKDIRKSIKIIKNSGVEYEFRTTCVPGIHSREDILQIARNIAPARAYFLQSFRPEKTLNSKLEKVRPYPRQFLSEIKKEIGSAFRVCEIR